MNNQATIWIATSQPFQGIFSSIQKTLIVNNPTDTDLISKEVINLYNSSKDLPKTALNFGVNLGNDSIMQGMIQDGKIQNTLRVN